MRFFSFLSGLLAILIFVPNVFAIEKINSFDVDIVAHEDGLMTVTENIQYDFGENDRHGIFRTIPLVSKVGDLYRVIEVDFKEVKRDGKDEPYEVDKSAGETEVKIGDADVKISGSHNYIIIYEVKNGIGSNYEDHDEIYWNATGNDWEVEVEKASLKIGTDFGSEPLESVCYTGPKSSKFQNCVVDKNLVNTTQTLDPYTGLTTVTRFPANTFPKSVLQKSEPVFDPDFLSFLKIYFPIVLILNLIVAPFLLFKYFTKWRGKSFGSPSVNFDIPKDLSPAQAGAIDNAKLDRDDVTATIFDLAIRKYIKIEEVKVAKTLMPDEIDYKLRLTPRYRGDLLEDKIIKVKSSDGLNDFEQLLFSRLFRDGDEVSLKELKTDFYSTFSQLEGKLFHSLMEKKLYTRNPGDQSSSLLLAGIILLVSGNVILGPVVIFLSRKLTPRTDLGNKLDHEVDGLKIFLKAMSRHYKFQTKNLITVEKYIPYAIALGLQDEFMEQLKIIDPNYKPSWYSGNHSFMHSYSGMYSSMGSNMITSAPSSSSGFSGGSSGGGGGGGGGGSW